MCQNSTKCVTKKYLIHARAKFASRQMRLANLCKMPCKCFVCKSQQKKSDFDRLRCQQVGQYTNVCTTPYILAMGSQMDVQKVRQRTTSGKILLLYARMKYLRWKLYAFVVKAWAECVCCAKTFAGRFEHLRITRHK